MVSKHSNVTVGRTMLYTDLFIISSSYFVTLQIDKVVFGPHSASSLLLRGRHGNQHRPPVAVAVHRLSSKWEEIATAINNEARTADAVLTGMGWYSKKEVKVLLVMCRKNRSRRPLAG